MPKIPQYEQGQLASSVVGTAGVDTSGADIFGTMAKGLGQVQDVLYQGIAADVQEQQKVYRQKQAEQKALDDAQKKLLQDVEVKNHQIGLNAALNDVESEVQQNNQTTPYMADKVYADAAAKRVDDYLKTNTLDPTVAARVKLGAMTDIDSGMGRMRSWSLSKRTEIARAYGETLLKDLTDKGGKTLDTEGVTALWEQIDALKPQLEITHGADATAMVDAAKAKAAEEHIYGLINDRQYDKADAEMASHAFDSIGQDKIRELRQAAANLKNGQERQQQLEIRTDALSERVAIAQQSVDTPSTDLNAVRDLNVQLRQRLTLELSKPAKEQNLGLVQDIKSEINRTDKILNPTDKQKAAEKVAKDKETHAKFADNRLYLDQWQAAMDAHAWTTPEAHLTDLEKFKVYLNKVNTRGGLTEDEYSSYLKFVAKQNEQIKAGKSSKKGVVDAVQGLFGAADKKHSQLPAAPGKTKAQTHAEANAKYKTAYDAMYERRKKAVGRELNDREKIIIHNMALQEANANGK